MKRILGVLVALSFAFASLPGFAGPSTQPSAQGASVTKKQSVQKEKVSKKVAKKGGGKKRHKKAK